MDRNLLTKKLLKQKLTSQEFIFFKDVQNIIIITYALCHDKTKQYIIFSTRITINIKTLCFFHIQDDLKFISANARVIKSPMKSKFLTVRCLAVTIPKQISNFFGNSFICNRG